MSTEEPTANEQPTTVTGSGPTALLVSGSGHWADPWHPYPATSERLRQLLEGRGLAVTVSAQVEDALVGLYSEDTPHPDLLVLNVGNTDGPSPDVAPDQLGELPSMPVLEAVAAGISAHLDRGGALLAVHSAATALATQDLWSRLLGGRWVRGHTMHPPLAGCTVDVPDTGHPVTRGLSDFEVTDERYSWLHTEDDVTVLAEHHHAGERHPLVWARDNTSGSTPARVLYDALGHDERSYDSPDHVRLLEQGVDWLLHRTD